MAPQAFSDKKGKRELYTDDSGDEDELARGSPPSSPDENVPKEVPIEEIQFGNSPKEFFFNYRAAFNYITKVKQTCSPLAIGAFRELINDLSVKCVDEADVIPRLENMFGTYKHLVREFNVFRSPRGKFIDVASTVQGVHRLQTVVEEALDLDLQMNSTVRSRGGHTIAPAQRAPTLEVVEQTKELLDRAKKEQYHCDLCANQDYPMDNMVEVGDSEEYKAQCAANLAKDRARLRQAGLY